MKILTNRPAIATRLLLIASLAALPLSAPLLHANDPEKDAKALIKNGDFEKGGANWRGDRKVIDEPGATGDKVNRVNAVELKKTQVKEFSQDLVTSNLKDIVITFRYKASEDYTGRGFQMKMERPNGSSTFRNIPVPDGGGDWKTVKWPFSEIREDNRLKFIIEVREGEGTLYFDDFTSEIKG